MIDTATAAILANGAAGNGTITNALSLAGGIANLSIPLGAADTLANAVTGAGTLALYGGTFVLPDAARETQAGGIVLETGTLDLPAGPGGQAGHLSFGPFGGADLIYGGTVAAGTTIAGFGGDTIDLTGIVATSGTFGIGNTLTLHDGATAVAQFVLTGAVGNLRYVGDGHGGTGITADSAWAAPVAGTWSTASNWDGGVVPTGTDVAYFSLDSSTPYTVSGGGTAAGIDVQGDQVTLSGAYTLSDTMASQPSGTFALRVGSNGALSIGAGASLGDAGNAEIGDGTGGGTLTLAGGMSAGSVVVLQGGTLAVQGAGASATITDLRVGADTGGAEGLPATLDVSGGAALSDTTAFLGGGADPGGAFAIVSGAGSRWISGAGGLAIGGGSGEPARLSVLNRGLVSSSGTNLLIAPGGTLAAAASARIVATIELRGGGAINAPLLTAADDIGQTGADTLTLGNPVVLDGGNVAFADAPGTTLSVAGPISSTSASGNIDVTGRVVFGDAANSFANPVEVGGDPLGRFAGTSGIAEEAATGAFGTGTIDFVTGTVVYDAGVAVGNAIANLAPGDVLDLRGLPYEAGAAAVLNGTTLTVISGAASTTLSVLGLPAGTLFNAAPDGSGGTDVGMQCFATGTPIATADGWQPVETLRPGSSVRCADGRIRPVIWTGARSFDVAAHPFAEFVAPVRLRAGAVARGAPSRDIWLSPDHAVLLDGMLIPVRRLLNGTTVAQVLPAQVRYHHVAVEGHAILLAAGLAAESLLDPGLLAGEPGVPRPAADTAPCRPYVEDDASARHLWERLAARAALLGEPYVRRPVACDPDLHLLVDGRRIDPVGVAGGRYSFALPRACRRVALRSRAAPPAAVRPWMDDRRRLGVAVRGIRLDDGETSIDLAPDHPSLGAGWWQVEPGARPYRWTDGAGELNLPPGTALLAVDVVPGGVYPAA